MSEPTTVEVKVYSKLDDASFRAYSDITADERQLHGNVGTVVNLETAKAIVKDIFADVKKRNKQLQDLSEHLKSLNEGCHPLGNQSWLHEIKNIRAMVEELLKP